MKREQRDQARARLLTLASRPSGCTLYEVGGGSTTVDMAAQELVKEGRLFKVKIGHRTIRYYTDKATADAMTPAAPNVVVNPKGLKMIGDAIITEKTKFTKCPSPPEGVWHRSQFSNW